MLAHNAAEPHERGHARASLGHRKSAGGLGCLGRELGGGPRGVGVSNKGALRQLRAQNRRLELRESRRDSREHFFASETGAAPCLAGA